jgi:integrase
MAPKVSYLFESPKGYFEYRRRVPKKLQVHFPRTATGGLMAEWKQSLDTNNSAVAQRRWVAETERFEATKALAETLYGQPTNKSEMLQSAVTSAKQMAVNYGVHPDQAPTLDHNATDEEIDAFKQIVHNWNYSIKDHKDLILNLMSDETIDVEQRDKDYKQGRWGQNGYQTPRKELDENHPLVAQLAVISGEVDTTLSSSWADATELYIKINKRHKKRLPDKEAKWELKTRALLERFAQSMDGPNTKLDDLDRQVVSDWMWNTYPKAGTRNRYNNTFSAVINCWNTEMKGKNVFNPFAGLSSKALEKEEASKRRSFNPDEWFSYLSLLNKCLNTEVKVIGLLILFTGCRTSEAAGLQVKDLKLSSNMPHVIFRTNSIRRMDKSDMERAVPLLTPILDAFRNYEIPSESEAPVFPSYYTAKGHGNASTALRHIVRSIAGIKDKDVVPYSARHTLKDRATAASVDPARAEYIMGHKSDGSSKIHKKYGTMPPPETLFEDMTKIFNTTQWGYYEDTN